MDDTLRNEKSMTTLDGYQTRAFSTAAYPGRGENQVIYPTVALVEEAGELARVVLIQIGRNLQAAAYDRLEQHAPEVPSEYLVAEATLELAATVGAVMGLVKKTYRNDPPGELTQERRDAITQAVLVASDAIVAFARTVKAADRVEFPPVPIPAEYLEQPVKEAGDALWYIADFCTEAHVSMGFVGDTNYVKLSDRARRGVIRDAGDNR